MNFNKILTILILFTFLFIPINALADDDDNTCDAWAGGTDADPFQLYAFLTCGTGSPLFRSQTLIIILIL